MAAAGVDIATQRSEHVAVHLPPAAAPLDLVIAVCDHAAASCPTIPGVSLLRWPFPDPAPGGIDVGADEAATAAAFAAVRDAIRARLEVWLVAGAPLDGSDPTAADVTSGGAEPCA
jgi:protein-tyrosine-phosphatase